MLQEHDLDCAGIFCNRGNKSTRLKYLGLLGIRVLPKVRRRIIQPCHDRRWRASHMPSLTRGIHIPSQAGYGLDNIERISDELDFIIDAIHGRVEAP